MRTVINGYCEIKSGEFYKFARTKDAWYGTHANSLGKIVKCKITIEWKENDDEQSKE